jgi:hypothetical protein
MRPFMRFSLPYYSDPRANQSSTELVISKTKILLYYQGIPRGSEEGCRYGGEMHPGGKVSTLLGTGSMRFCVPKEGCGVAREETATRNWKENLVRALMKELCRSAILW